MASKEIDREVTDVAREQDRCAPESAGGGVGPVVGVGAGDAADQGPVSLGPIRVLEKNLRTASVTDRAVPGDLLPSRTITRSHSSSSSSVHTKSTNRSSASERTRSMTLKGNSSFASTKTRSGRATCPVLAQSGSQGFRALLAALALLCEGEHVADPDAAVLAAR